MHAAYRAHQACFWPHGLQSWAGRNHGQAPPPPRRHGVKSPSPSRERVCRARRRLDGANAGRAQPARRPARRSPRRRGRRAHGTPRSRPPARSGRSGADRTPGAPPRRRRPWPRWPSGGSSPRTCGVAIPPPLRRPRRRPMSRLPPPPWRRRWRLPVVADRSPRLASELQDRHRKAARTGDDAGQARGETAVGALVHGEQETFQIGHEPLRLERFALEALALGVAACGKRLRAQRSVGGMTRVVATAMVTIIVNKSWLSMPSESPIEATMTSVEPRAFMPQASATHSRMLRPPIRPPMKAPAALSNAGDGDQAESERQQSRISQDAQIGGETGEREEHRHEQAEDQAAQLLVDLPRQDRRSGRPGCRRRRRPARCARRSRA